MSRTISKVSSETGHSGGLIFICAELLGKDSANLAITRNGNGDYSLNRVAAGAEVYNVWATPQSIRRTLEAYDTQNLFGGSVGPSPRLPLKPPMTAAQMAGQYTATAAVGKGFRIDDIFLVYSVGVVALTAGALSLRRTIFADNVAPAVTNIGIDATALPLTVQANRLVTRALTAPDYHVDDLSDLTGEFSFTMANTGTIRVYGIGFHVTFNFD